MGAPFDAARELARLVAGLASETTESTTETLVKSALTMIPGAQHASITVRERTGYTSLGVTSDLAARCDELQYVLDEGPCVDAASPAGEPHGGPEWVRSGDILRDPRWPRWAEPAAETGARSALTVRLVARENVPGALNLYSEELGAFADPEDVDFALLFALHATVALRTNHAIGNLRVAMQSRHSIGVAQGILMKTYDLDLDTAFQLLVRYSSQTNTKLREVAEHVVCHRRLPGTDGGSVRPAAAPAPAPAPAQKTGSPPVTPSTVPET